MKTRTINRTMKGSPSRDAVFAIRSEREYELAVQRLGTLVEQIGDDLQDPRYNLIETLSFVIDAYDREHYALPEASGVARRQSSGR